MVSENAAAIAWANAANADAKKRHQAAQEASATTSEQRPDFGASTAQGILTPQKAAGMTREQIAQELGGGQARSDESRPAPSQEQAPSRQSAPNQANELGQSAERGLPLPRTAEGMTQQQTSQALGVSRAQGMTPNAALEHYMNAGGGGNEKGAITQKDRNLEAYMAAGDANDRRAERSASNDKSQALENYMRDPSAAKSNAIDRSDRNLSSQYDAGQANERAAAQRGRGIEF